MPYKRHPRRKKKTVRRRKYAPVPSGMPKTRRAFLKYCDTFTITSTSGAMGSYVFRANGCHDPNFTGVGHQPMGWDQWKLLFNHFVVVGSKISVTYNTASSGAGQPTMFGIYLTDSTTVPYTKWEEFREARKGTSRTIQGANTNAITTKSQYSAKKFYNLTDIKDNVDRIGSNTDSTPTEQALFCCWLQTLNGSTTTFGFSVTIDYIIDFSEPKDLAQS